MQGASLSDDELWRAIAQNTNAMSALVRRQFELHAAMAGSTDIVRRARLMQSNAETIDKLERNYREYTTELRRRSSE